MALQHYAFIACFPLGLWGGERAPEAWGNISTIYAILCTVLVALMGLCIKEKHIEDTDGEGIQKGKVPVKELLRIIFKVKHFWLLVILFMAFYMASGVNGAATYFYRDVLGNLELLGLMSLLGVAPTLACMPFVPMLFKKFGKRKTVMVSLAITMASDLLAILMPTNIPIYCISRILNAVGKIPYSAAIFTFIADLVDYVWNKNKVRTEGLMAMASSVGQKVGMGFGTALVGWGLTWCGYNSLIDVQTGGTKFGITFIFFGIPLLCSLIAFIVIRGWDIGDND